MGHRTRDRHRFRTAPQSNSLVALAQIDLRQVVFVHQFDEAADLANVKHVARAGSRIGGHCRLP